MQQSRISHQIPEPSVEDLKRIEDLLHQIGGPNVVWGPQQVLDVWVLEQRAKLDQQISARVGTASWALVAATVGLALFTAGLIWATLTA